MVSLPITPGVAVLTRSQAYKAWMSMLCG